MIKKTSSLGMLIGAAALTLPAMPSSAEANTVVLQQADPADAARTRIRNGVEVLRPTDEEYTPEMATFAVDPGGTAGVVVMMSTGQLDGPAGPNTGAELPRGNMQGACMPFSLVEDATTNTGVSLAPDTANYKYISDRNADEGRAFNHPVVKAIGGGMFVIAANWDRNNKTNTERFAQIVDSQCNLQTLTGNVTLREDNTSAEIMAKNNDNCAGEQAGGGGSIHIAADGSATIVAEALCNGNGRDDGWLNSVTYSCDGGTCNVNKNFDVSVIDQEERSRGRCEQLDTTADGTPDMSICCGTEGNNQPQRDGVWCAGVDHASEDVIWKEKVAHKGETAEGRRTYAMRIKMLAERTVTGALTGQVVLQYQMHRGNNNNNKKGGYDDKVMLAVATPGRNGLNMSAPQDITNAVILNQVEMTHSTMIQTFTGPASAPVSTFGFLAPNHNGTSVGANILNIPVTGGLAGEAQLVNLAAPMDGQKYSKYLGNNPNNQGRNYNDCHVVANPFMNAAGAKSAGVPVLNLCAVTGKAKIEARAAVEAEMGPALKPDLLMEIWTSLEVPQAAPTPGATPSDTGSNPNPGTPLDPADPTPTTNETDTNAKSGFASSGGCSTSGGSTTGGLSMLLLGLALVAIRRRRSL